jgi:hypothetical protein
MKKTLCKWAPSNSPTHSLVITWCNNRQGISRKWVLLKKYSQVISFHWIIYPSYFSPCTLKSIANKDLLALWTFLRILASFVFLHFFNYCTGWGYIVTFTKVLTMLSLSLKYETDCSCHFTVQIRWKFSCKNQYGFCIVLTSIPDSHYKNKMWGDKTDGARHFKKETLVAD